MNEPHLGILMLETRFPRPVGDVGNRASFAFPVRFAVISGATPQRVVRERAAELLLPFIDHARALIDGGAVAIGTSCGFLTLFQRELAEALPVPVATSSLLQVPWLRALLPARQVVGLVTIDAASLSADHLHAVGIDGDVPIEGMPPDGEFARRLLNDEPTLDVAQAEREVVAAAERLIARRPDVGAIVLECTNMPPYGHAVRCATGRPVFDVITLLNWVWSGVVTSTTGRPA